MEKKFYLVYVVDMPSLTVRFDNLIDAENHARKMALEHMKKIYVLGSIKGFKASLEETLNVTKDELDSLFSFLNRNEISHEPFCGCNKVIGGIYKLYEEYCSDNRINIVNRGKFVEIMNEIGFGRGCGRERYCYVYYIKKN